MEERQIHCDRSGQKFQAFVEEETIEVNTCGYSLGESNRPCDFEGKRQDCLYPVGTRVEDLLQEKDSSMI